MLHLLCRVGFHRAKYMRVAVDQFLAKTVAYGFDVERLLLFADLGVKDNV